MIMSHNIKSHTLKMFENFTLQHFCNQWDFLKMLKEFCFHQIVQANLKQMSEFLNRLVKILPEKIPQWNVNEFLPSKDLSLILKILKQCFVKKQLEDFSTHFNICESFSSLLKIIMNFRSLQVKSFHDAFSFKLAGTTHRAGMFSKLNFLKYL